jgi:hypothetical protein
MDKTQFLPKFVVAAHEVYKSYKKETTFPQDPSFETLKNTAIAIGAYVATVKVGSRFSINLPIAGCLTTAYSPEAGQLGVAGYLFGLAVKGVITAVKSHDVKSAFKNIFVAAVAYYITTPHYGNLSFRKTCSDVNAWFRGPKGPENNEEKKEGEKVQEKEKAPE